MSDIVLKTDGLNKYYGSLHALKGLNIEVKQGEVWGILGPNGSGKTTSLAIVLGILNQSSGVFNWFEKELTPENLKQIGSLIETPNFYPYLNIEKNLKISAKIKNVDEKDIPRVLNVVKLDDRLKTKFSACSYGMKQRLALASMLLGDPKVLVLDEPTNGLDPEGIAEVRDIIKKEADKGKTIILASHILDEVEKVCSHVAILKKGDLIAKGRVSELLGGDDIITLAASDNEVLYEFLVDQTMVKTIRKEKDDLVLSLHNDYSSVDLNKLIIEKGIILSKMNVSKRSLESSFLELVK